MSAAKFSLGDKVMIAEPLRKERRVVFEVAAVSVSSTEPYYLLGGMGTIQFQESWLAPFITTKAASTIPDLWPESFDGHSDIFKRLDDIEKRLMRLERGQETIFRPKGNCVLDPKFKVGQVVRSRNNTFPDYHKVLGMRMCPDNIVRYHLPGGYWWPEEDLEDASDMAAAPGDT